MMKTGIVCILYFFIGMLLMTFLFGGETINIAYIEKMFLISLGIVLFLAISIKDSNMGFGLLAFIIIVAGYIS